MPSEPRVIQVTNVAPAATREQMKTLFNFIGKVDELVLYPEGESSSSSTKVCYVKFADPEDVGVSLHLTNTVFIDRALIIVPVPDGRIPDEKTALGSQNGLSLYPALPASTELSKVDEIRRTVYVANIDVAVTPETLMQYFGTHAGEVKYARMAGDEGYAVHAAFIEFTEQVSVMRALGLSGQVLGSRAITVVPANTSIVKTSSSGIGSASSREIEEAMRKVNEAQPLIDAVLDSEGGDRRRGSRSRSHRSRSHRSRSRSRRSRSRKRSRSRSHRSRRRSTSRSPRRRSPSPRRRRSKSRSPDRKRSSHRSKSPSYRKSRRDRRDADGSVSRSPIRGDRDKESGRSSRDRSSTKKDSSHRSRSPTSRGSRRERDREPRSDRDRDKSRGHKDSKEQHGDRKGRSDEKSKRERDSDRKSSSSKHSRDRESEKRSRKSARSYDDEEHELPEGTGSDYEQQPEDRDEQSAASDENRSDGDEQADSPRDANTSRMDMDVDSE